MSLFETTPWKKGDFHVIGAAQTIVGEYLCEDAGFTAGHTILDVACGSGNTALALARRGNAVTGLDIVEALIERAKVRARAEGFDIEFQTGNCEELPYGDHSFDAVTSTFGAMFAPDQQRAASEMLRVCKPGGTIAMSNWVPESWPGAMFGLPAKYGSPPPGFAKPPTEWGTVQGLRRLFGGQVSTMRLFDRFVYARAVDSRQLLATFKQYFGPMVMLFERVDSSRHHEVEQEIMDIFERYNRATDGTLCSIMQYINVVMTKGTP